ncbi:MAG: threonylcarbamoyl-AMP synthase [Gammaproteobacteria bacterium]|nr:MAG: threonylcarbamoyl-AMP synthase [Gammaproteobacteria bacterium]PIE39297.1 MAG: threonylcarbamoyl-AMP synthase [Gammaproteobacteria bacterium]
MSQFFQIHTENPQVRLVRQAVEIIRGGGVVVFPTDSTYALGCRLGDKDALARIRQIRQLDERHNFALLCRDLSDLATYAKVDNMAYRLLKHATPGPYTFILQATSEVPRRLLHPRKKTVGLRVPDNVITQAILEDLGEPMMSVTMTMPGDEHPLMDPYDIRNLLERRVDLVIDGGFCGIELTSVIDLIEDTPVILREGLGDMSLFA